MAHPTPDSSDPVRDRGPAPTPHAASNAQAGEIEPILATAGVSKTFPGVKALQNVDFRLFPGEVHTLMGQNGAGKSTLINVLTGVVAPDAGVVHLGGQDRKSVV